MPENKCPSSDLNNLNQISLNTMVLLRKGYVILKSSFKTVNNFDKTHQIGSNFKLETKGFTLTLPS